MKPNLNLFTFLLLAKLFVGAAPAAGDAARRADIVVILCDRLNAQVLSWYGGPVKTPHMDRLAREGVQFFQATTFHAARCGYNIRNQFRVICSAN